MLNAEVNRETFTIQPSGENCISLMKQSLEAKANLNIIVVSP